ncbi:hypothetical protein SH580_16415 [Coraliomargarita algicola]|uniref:O-antigen polymerase n=1 Tax=Coraliomargarita algicola TaxID=3092156 RepID=A0ABZ0RHS1_9BACT|nr:hypothetical protein [Coraliomargarita sp. J2-16]WPJ95013.1 hypothetical protein SH580_16415 [Coraliomargarita sp. J2-16]
MNRPTSKAQQRSAFTLKNIFRNGLFIAVVFFLNKLGPPGSLLGYLCLFVMASRSTEGAIKALSLGALFIVANSYLVSINFVHTYLRFPLVAVAGLRIFWDAYRRSPKVFFQGHLIALLLFGGVSLLCAFINQYFFMVSFLKLGVFVYGVYAIMVGTDLGRTSGSDLTVWFCSMVLFYIAGNLLAYALGVGYTFRGRLTEAGGSLGLAGMTNHPQTQGPLSAISSIYAICVFLYTPYRLRWLMALAAPVLLVLCYLSAARTGIFAVALAICLILGITILLSQGRKRIRLNISIPQLILMIFGGTVGLFLLEVFTGGALSSKFSEFALKAIREGGGSSFSFSQMFESRMPLIEQSLYGFHQSPLTGIGFGTELDPLWAATATLFTAPTEKGFLPTAILEETGIFGTFCFVVFLILFFKNYLSKRNVVAIGVMACFLLLNLGEMMFFALGGMGLYCWSILGAAIALGDRVVERG